MTCPLWKGFYKNLKLTHVKEMSVLETEKFAKNYCK